MIFSIEKAIELIKNSGGKQTEHPEFMAIASHWLQSPECVPTWGNHELKNKWLNVLLAGFSLRTQDELIKLISNSYSFPFPPCENPKFRFIDLFAGIGGFRISLQDLGGKCVFTSEWDKNAKQTYFSNYGEMPFGDIRQFTDPITITDETLDQLIPDFDILAAGFPCQPFSLAGVSARQSLGINHGFSCETQGTLFFDIVRIAKVKQPKILLLENVKNLKSHDGGNTFQTIKKTIEDDLGYSFSHKIINANTVVPQNRQRCFMVCLKNRDTDFVFPTFEGDPLPLESILEESPPEIYTISDKLWAGHISRTKRNMDRGTGFSAFEADLKKPSNTIVARYGKDGKECLIPQDGRNPRMLTPRECARLQGFPEEFLIPQGKTMAYKQFGNSVPVPVVRKIAKEIRDRYLS
ncbi:MAG: DNA (cytosine-5-)-methyltransferase [Deltaproteobacteria bacterium HGW-Deltaproteobacteria-4]|nr:MAG: DNA (cytosine-5-)-methyltransferase [Deltaproteobacteria bacterium HGW-Deltaproteobacteria-4]